MSVGLLLAGDIEARMIFDIALRGVVRQGQALEILRRYVGEAKAAIGAKAKAAVVSGIAEHDAAARASMSQPLQTLADQCLADALALPLRLHSDWAEPVSPDESAIDVDG